MDIVAPLKKTIFPAQKSKPNKLLAFVRKICIISIFTLTLAFRCLLSRPMNIKNKVYEMNYRNKQIILKHLRNLVFGNNSETKEREQIKDLDVYDNSSGYSQTENKLMVQYFHFHMIKLS